MANLSSFYETRDIFAQYVNYSNPLTFDQWHVLPLEKKSAALFVQFFDRIIQAWSKANAFDFIPSDDGVSIVCQYLEKNVPIIDKAPSRYKPSYIYKVAYNCMYCICHDLKSVQDRWDHEIPNIVQYGEDELDLFDTVVEHNSSADKKFSDIELAEEFWDAIEDIGLPAIKVLDYISSGNVSDLRALRKTSSYYANDPLRDVKLSLSEANEVIEILRDRLSDLYNSLEAM